MASIPEIYDAITKTLAENGTVDVATYNRVTRYTRKHRDMFRVKDGVLQVQSGRKWLTLSNANGLMVGIKCYD